MDRVFGGLWRLEARRGAPYGIGGSVLGVAAGDLVIEDNGTDNTTIAVASTIFTRPAFANGSTYNVTVASEPAGESCAVTIGRGLVNPADVTNVAISYVHPS